VTVLHERHTAADFLARARGGGLYTDKLSQRAGSWFALLGYRRGLTPTALTLGNLVLGLLAAVLVIVAHERHPVVAGAVALVLWQVAYALDCADGQLARVTGRASPAGKRLDILCDVALQIGLVAAVATVADRQSGPLPVWVTAAFAGTWLVNLVTSLLQTGDAAASLVTSTALPIQVLKLARDYGAVVLVIGLVLALAPQFTIWVLGAFTVVNGLFLLASIAAAARASASHAPS
jgi:phosphatidylglycerophosphate synthase